MIQKTHILEVFEQPHLKLVGTELSAFQPHLTPASVLVLIIEYEHGHHILFTKRRDDLPVHQGQVCFPGGKLDVNDDSVLAAALRETHEEIGVIIGEEAVIGRLATTLTLTGFEIIPVVALIQGPVRLQLNAMEVDSTFEVPLEYLLDDAHYEEKSVLYDGKKLHYFRIQYEKEVIWGATARVLFSLKEEFGSLKRSAIA